MRKYAVITTLVALGSLACEPALLTPIEGENAEPNNTTANNGSTTNPFAGDMAAAVDGEALYQASACETCHGAAGEGTAAFPALDATATLEDAEVFEVIFSGRTGTAMSAYGEDNGGPLSTDDTWRVVTFLRTLEE